MLRGWLRWVRHEAGRVDTPARKDRQASRRSEDAVTEPGRVSDEGTRAARDESSHGRDDLSQLRHELRTPLNQIIGYSELLEEEAAQAGLGQFVADLQKI